MDELAKEKIETLRFVFTRLLTRRWHYYLNKYSCENIVELGVYNGRNFRRLLLNSSPKLAVAVDAWVDDGVAGRNDTALSPNDREKQYIRFKRMMAGKPFVQICRGYTFDVVKQFPDGFFDFIYIDADHTMEACLQDLRDWWPKMRSGAAFTGDDYRRNTTPTGVTFGVIEALKIFSKEVGVEIFPLPRNGWATIKP